MKTVDKHDGIAYYVDNKLVGKFFTDGKIYRKLVSSSSHKMKIYDGYGIEEDIIQDLKRQGCTEIRLKEDVVHTYKSPFETWMKEGIVADHSSIQRFLSMEHMEKYNQEENG